MKSEKEYAQQFHDRSCCGIPKWLIPAIQARDIEVLEEAARLVSDVECYPMYETGGEPLHPVDFKQRCVTVVENRIAELKKEMGSESGGGCPTPRKRETVTMANESHPAAVRPAVTDADRIQAMFDALWSVSNRCEVGDSAISQAVDDALDGWIYRNE